MTNKSAQTREREAYFKAGAGLHGSYAVATGLVLSSVTALLSAVFDASPEQTAFAMAMAWMAALGIGRLAVTLKAATVDDLRVEIDRF